MNLEFPETAYLVALNGFESWNRRFEVFYYFYFVFSFMGDRVLTSERVTELVAECKGAWDRGVLFSVKVRFGVVGGEEMLDWVGVPKKVGDVWKLQFPHSAAYWPFPPFAVGGDYVYEAIKRMAPVVAEPVEPGVPVPGVGRVDVEDEDGTDVEEEFPTRTTMWDVDKYPKFLGSEAPRNHLLLLLQQAVAPGPVQGSDVSDKALHYLALEALLTGLSKLYRWDRAPRMLEAVRRQVYLCRDHAQGRNTLQVRLGTVASLGPAAVDVYSQVEAQTAKEMAKRGLVGGFVANKRCNRCGIQGHIAKFCRVQLQGGAQGVGGMPHQQGQQQGFRHGGTGAQMGNRSQH